MHRSDLWEWQVLKAIDFNSKRNELKWSGWKIFTYHPEEEIIVLRRPSKKHKEHCSKMDKIKNPKKVVQKGAEQKDTIEWWKEKF